MVLWFLVICFVLYNAYALSRCCTSTVDCCAWKGDVLLSTAGVRSVLQRQIAGANCVHQASWQAMFGSSYYQPHEYTRTLSSPKARLDDWLPSARRRFARACRVSTAPADIGVSPTAYILAPFPGEIKAAVGACSNDETEYMQWRSILGTFFNAT